MYKLRYLNSVTALTVCAFLAFVPPLQWGCAHAQQLVVVKKKSAKKKAPGAKEEKRETQERTKRAEYQLSRHAKPTAVRSDVLSEKIATFSTYSPFPTSQERKRVLSWFAK